MRNFAELAAMRTQLDSIILQHEVVEQNREPEHPPHPAGNLNPVWNLFGIQPSLVGAT